MAKKSEGFNLSATMQLLEQLPVLGDSLVQGVKKLLAAFAPCGVDLCAFSGFLPAIKPIGAAQSDKRTGQVGDERLSER